jgi:hypothetical protein
MRLLDNDAITTVVQRSTGKSARRITHADNARKLSQARDDDGPRF